MQTSGMMSRLSSPTVPMMQLHMMMGSWCSIVLNQVPALAMLLVTGGCTLYVGSPVCNLHWGIMQPVRAG